MWCPRCGGEYREGITHCPSCDLDLVAEPPEPEYSLETGPLTGRPIEEEVEAVGPTLAGSFVTYEEAHAALRALSDAGIAAEIAPSDEQFPMTFLGAEPALGVVVAPVDAPRAREILRSAGLLPTAVARFRRGEDAHAAAAALQARGLKPRISVLVLDEVPAEFREEMEPYILEVPAHEKGPAMEILEGTVLTMCEACGAQLQAGDAACRTCGEPVAA
jgi:hypothetical protein